MGCSLEIEWFNMREKAKWFDINGVSVVSGYKCVNGYLLTIISISNRAACIFSSLYISLLFGKSFLRKSFTLR